MVETSRTATVRAENRAELIAEALTSRDEASLSAHGFAAADVHAYLRARAGGKPAPRPQSKAWHG